MFYFPFFVFREPLLLFFFQLFFLCKTCMEIAKFFLAFRLAQAQTQTIESRQKVAACVCSRRTFLKWQISVALDVYLWPEILSNWLTVEIDFWQYFCTDFNRDTIHWRIAFKLLEGLEELWKNLIKSNGEHHSIWRQLESKVCLEGKSPKKTPSISSRIFKPTNFRCRAIYSNQDMGVSLENVVKTDTAMIIWCQVLGVIYRQLTWLSAAQGPGSPKID